MPVKRTAFFLLFVIGVLILFAPPLDPWKVKKQSAALLPIPPPVEAQELARLRHQLRWALGLLEQCFGQKVDLNRIKSTPVTITAYSSTKVQCDSTPYITASEAPVRVGILAVSTDLLKEMGLSFGQRVLIPGYGLFEVRDTMHPRWRRRVDIWESNTKAARHFGTQKGTLIWVSGKEDHPKVVSSSSS